MTGQGELFELPPLEGEYQHTFKPLHNRIWTKNKARLIERYLYYFVQITKHGTYIDGFAGPQYPDDESAWAAKLVLESRPAWLRNFFLCEIDKNSYAKLTALINSQPEIKNRTIKPWHGDFNTLLPNILETAAISPKEASFCLLDQRTFECEWKSVETLSKVKDENKIELFYFFPTGWIGRAISATKDHSIINRWWGRDDWRPLQHLRAAALADLMSTRFKNELGCKYVFSWPIFKEETGGSVMYHMIHASDHIEAPNLMSRAYRQAVYAHEPPEQFLLELEAWQHPKSSGNS